MAVKFVNIDRNKFLSKTLIYKYCSLEKCLDMLQKQHLFFVSPTEWTDPFESRFLTNHYQIDNNAPVECPWDQKIFCTCTTETPDSEAYWKVYPQQQIGIRLAFYREKLLEELEQYSTNHPNETVYIGKVQYQDTKYIVGNIVDNPIINEHITSKGIDDIDLMLRLLLLKRNSFAYEDEIRIFIVEKKCCIEKGFEVSLQVPMNELIATITIDPSTPEKTAKLLKKTLTMQYGFSSSNPYRHRVVQSQLYKKLGKTTIQLQTPNYRNNLISKYETFMNVVDWDELTIGEKEVLYDMTYSKHDNHCTPFNISFKGDQIKLVYQINPKDGLSIHRKELPDFRKWLEDTYMNGEDGYSYLDFLRAMEKDERN